MKNFNAIGPVVVFASSAFFSPMAQAHASLKSSSPAAGATVHVAPKEVTLTFNEKVEEAFSVVTVKDGMGKDTTAGKAKVDAADGTTLHLELPALSPGAYSVHWIAVGHDGHRRVGDFQFMVK